MTKHFIILKKTSGEVSYLYSNGGIFTANSSNPIIELFRNVDVFNESKTINFFNENFNVSNYTYDQMIKIGSILSIYYYQNELEEIKLINYI